MNARNRFGYALCLIIGAVFLVIGIFMLNKNAEFKKNGVKTTASILSISEEYDSGDTIYYITIKYLANGKEYQKVIQEFSASLEVGEKVEIYYLPSNPTEILIEKLDNVLPIAITCVGGVVFVLGIVLIIGHYRKKKLNEYLKVEGICLPCEITYFTYQENYRFSQKKRKAIRTIRLLNDYMVKLKCKDSYGRIYKENFYMQLKDVYNVGDTIYVYVHPINPKKFFIDRKSYLENLELKGINDK